jgi:hypothetical protein
VTSSVSDRVHDHSSSKHWLQAKPILSPLIEFQRTNHLENQREHLQCLNAIYSVNWLEKWTPERNAIGRTHVRASSEHAWDPMASPSVNFCRKKKNRTTLAAANAPASMYSWTMPSSSPLCKAASLYSKNSRIKNPQPVKVALRINNHRNQPIVRPSVFRRNLQCEPVGKWTREECQWSHACKSFKRI